MNVEVGDVEALLTHELDLDEGEIGADSTAEEIENWDSLGHIAVCMALEARYGISIPMDKVSELQSVKAIVEYLESL